MAASYIPVANTEPCLSKDAREEEGQDQRSSFDSEETTVAATRSSVRWYRLPLLPWVLSTFSLAVVCLGLIVHLVTVENLCVPSPFGDFDTGFRTDLEAAKPFTEGMRKRFTGSVAFYENGTMYRQYNPKEPPYVGYPNPEIDKAWKDLTYGSGIDLPDDMIGRLKDKTWEEIRGGKGGMWRTGLDVFHQLHCLNYVRKALYPKYYVQDDIDRLFWMHIDHCIDYIRQALMCSADATPVRLVWRKESRFLIPQFDQYHTCRNFDLLKSFSDEHALELYVEENERDIKQAIKAGIL